MIAVVIPTCDHHYIPPDYGTIPVIIIYDDENLEDLKAVNNIKKKDKRIKVIVNKK